MIEKVRLRYFKQFENHAFELKDVVVLTGRNNAGKTTLLQAIAAWHFAFRAWEKRETSPAKPRTKVALTRKEFLSVPVQAFKLLWTDTLTALRRDEEEGKAAGAPRIMEITLEGKTEKGEPWDHTMEFQHAGSELIYAQPRDPKTSPAVRGVVYLPSFSGIEIEEKVHTREYQEWLIGQGKPGDIIRNLLAEISRTETAWNALSAEVENIFQYRLLKPQYEGLPFIVCEYLPGIPRGQGFGGYPRLEIANAGSGFLQTLLLLAFFYARPSTVVLIDEPDAHLHVSLQKQIYDYLRSLASKRHCQMVVATHSEVVIDNTDPNKIVSCFGKPHVLVRATQATQRDEVREALKRLTSQDLALAEQGKVLYVEDHSDFSILRAWAGILKHRLLKWFSDPYYHPVKSNDPKAAEDHFSALRAVNPQMAGVVLLDGDNNDAEDHRPQLKMLRWKHYEIENYLVHPSVLERFVGEKAGSFFASAARNALQHLLPPVVMNDPGGHSDYMKRTPASQSILPEVFAVASLETGKMEYYQIAEGMRPKEIHPEVQEKLDAIADHFGV